MSIKDRIRHLINGPEIAVFHKFKKPPYGGGNQFLLALTKELARQGYDIGTNTVGKNTKVVLFNSFEIDKDKLEKLYKKYQPRMVQRLAGPIGIYRGTDIEIDKKIWSWNKEFADATIFISNFSFRKYEEIGLPHKNPHIILNGCDSDIFYSEQKTHKKDGGKIKLIASAWSNNPRKGGPLLSWLDEHLDKDIFELTFVGRTKEKFKNAKIIDPVPSKELAQILRQHDIYIAPSMDDPCSNALIEALSCGLPAIFRKSGGHPEIVKEAGLGFNSEEEALEAIKKVSSNLESYRDKIAVPPIEVVAKEYLKVFFPNDNQ